MVEFDVQFQKKQKKNNENNVDLISLKYSCGHLKFIQMLHGN